MNCPRCQMSIANPSEVFCPRCGYAFQPPQLDGGDVASVPSGMQAAPPTYPGPISQQMPMGPFPGYGAPPSGSLYGSGPGMLPPPYPPYGVPAPGTTPFAPPSAGAPAAPPKRRNYALVGLLVLLIVAVVAGSGAAIYMVAKGQHGPNSPTAAGPTATASYNVIFQDPLTSNVNGWANDSHCFFGNDGYHVKDGYICYAPMEAVADADVSVQVRQVAGEADWFYGLQLRRQSTNQHDYYAFVITSNGDWKFDKWVNGVRDDIVPYVPTSALHRGLDQINTLRVRMVGSHFVFFINGTQVGEKTDASYSSGGLGIEGNTQGGVEVVYTNFAVAEPS